MYLTRLLTVPIFCQASSWKDKLLSQKTVNHVTDNSLSHKTVKHVDDRMAVSYYSQAVNWQDSLLTHNKDKHVADQIALCLTRQPACSWQDYLHKTAPGQLTISQDSQERSWQDSLLSACHGLWLTALFTHRARSRLSTFCIVCSLLRKNFWCFSSDLVF